MFESRFRAIDRELTIVCDDERAHEYLCTAYRRLARDANGRTAASDRGALATSPPHVRFNGEPMSVAGLKSKPTLLEIASYGSAALFCQSVLLGDEHDAFYAAAVERQNIAAMICAPTSGGKTTLVLELVAQGCRLYGDEFVFVRRSDGYALPFPRTLMVRETTLGLLSDPRVREYCSSHTSARAEKPRIWDYVDAGEVFGEAVYAKPAPLRAIIFLEPPDSGGARSRRLNTSEGALRAVRYVQGDAKQKRDFWNFFERYGSVAYFELTLASTRDGAATLLGIVEGLRANDNR